MLKLQELNIFFVSDRTRVAGILDLAQLDTDRLDLTGTVALFLLEMAKLAISASSSSGGSEHEMNLIDIVYFFCQTYCPDAFLVDQNFNMRIQRP